MKLQQNPIINLLVHSWRYSPRKRVFVTFVFLSVIANLIILLEPIIIGRVFNSVQFSYDDPNLLRYITINLLFLILITVGFWIFHGTSRVMEEKNAFLVRKTYKREMFDKILDLSATWHKDHHSGDTIDKVNKSSRSVFNFSTEIFTLVQNFVKLFGSFIILALFDWKIALGSVVVSIFAIWTSLSFDRVLRVGYRKIFKAQNYLASAIHDYISNVITIITLRLKKRVSTEIERRSMIAYDVFGRNRKIDEFRWFMISFYSSVTISVALIVSAYTSFTFDGVIIIGTLFVLYKYLSNVSSFFFNFAWRYGQIVRQDTAVREVEFINKEHRKIVKEKKKVNLPSDWSSIKVENLYFTYDNQSLKDQGYSLDNVSFTIGKGSKIALVGESGSGKSTILSLIRGLHNTDQVKVFSGGQRLRQGLKHLNSHTTLIPQDPEIFNSTIKDNVTMGIETSPKEINRAIKLARFDKVIDRLEKGLNTNILEKGVSLSGGEKQRLALARGLLVAEDYDLILLDEPTSSVDSENEILIYQDIFETYKDKTIISSIHRLHLLRFFDYIYFFNKGRVVAEGTFNTLLNDKDFKELWENYSKNGEDL